MEAECELGTAGLSWLQCAQRAGRGGAAEPGAGQRPVGRGIPEPPGSLAPPSPPMTGKEPLPLLGTLRPRSLRGWVGPAGAPVGSGRVVSSGLGPPRHRGWRELT